MSMITATTWVPRGFAAQFPQKYEFNEEEFDRISRLAKLQLEEAQDDLAEAEAGTSSGNGAISTNGAVSQTKEYALTHSKATTD